MNITGALSGNGITHADIKVSAICNRVGVSNGHSICVSVKLKNWDGDIQKAQDVLNIEYFNNLIFNLEQVSNNLALVFLKN